MVIKTNKNKYKERGEPRKQIQKIQGNHADPPEVRADGIPQKIYKRNQADPPEVRADGIHPFPYAVVPKTDCERVTYCNIPGSCPTLRCRRRG